MKHLSLLIVIIILLSSCSSTLHFEGPLTYVNNDTVGIGNQRFIVNNDTCKVGQYATFTSTVKRKLINSRIIRN